MNLYEINEKIASFEFIIDEETGEITNGAEFDALELAQNEKIENIALYIKNLTAEVEALKKEEENFKQRRKSKENKINWLKRYLVNNMQGRKFESAKCKISFRKSQKVVITDMEKLPQKYQSFKEVIYNVDKAKIKEAINNGEEIQGACIQEENNIIIK